MADESAVFFRERSPDEPKPLYVLCDTKPFPDDLKAVLDDAFAPASPGDATFPLFAYLDMIGAEQLPLTLIPFGARPVDLPPSMRADNASQHVVAQSDQSKFTQEEADARLTAEEGYLAALCRDVLHDKYRVGRITTGQAGMFEYPVRFIVGIVCRPPGGWDPAVPIPGFALSKAEATAKQAAVKARPAHVPRAGGRRRRHQGPPDATYADLPYGSDHPQARFCRCETHVSAKQPEWCLKEKAWREKRDGKTCYNPYAVCNASVKDNPSNACWAFYKANAAAIPAAEKLALGLLHGKPID